MCQGYKHTNGQPYNACSVCRLRKDGTGKPPAAMGWGGKCPAYALQHAKPFKLEVAPCQ
jgi:hypothetical protein